MAYDEPADLIGSCEATLDTLALLLGDLGEEVAETPGAWTIAEILNHLLDTEQRYLGRVRRMRRELRPSMRMMPDPDYTKLSALKAWTQFYELRKRHLKLLRSLKPAEWRRSGTLTPVGKISIGSLVRHMAAHDAMHTAQIARRLSGRQS
ncbi:MAG TPA: DinB family protein [Candidatus Dormibacteraeota bacterium]|nr:DinB family protein [Candidatus Dormibacteraeota bacterium]